MYPSSSSSSSSSSQKSMSSNSGLIRYGSAPGSFLTNAVDSVIGSHDFTASLGSQQAAPNPHHHHHHHQRPPPPPSLLGQYFSAADSSSVTSESTCKVNASDRDNAAAAAGGGGGGGGLQRSFGFSDLTVGGGSSSSCPQLVRQRSSPAGFLSHLAAENAFSLSRGGSIGSSCNNNNGGQGQLGGSRLKSQLSFTRQDSQLSQISEVSESNIEDGVVVGHGHGNNNGTHSASFTTTTSFGIDSSSSWPDNHHNTNSIVFSAPPSTKRHRTNHNNNLNMDGDIYTFHHPLETQFSMPETSLEMAAVERMLHVPDDSIPCKIRAKRGCATHPRSIAERERRTRISGRLKKLQDLVPNMDKQTSYSDMLDLAVQHIRTLQTQVQKLRHDLDNCKCGCKPTS